MTDLRRLADFFAADDIEFKPIAVSKKTGKALAAAYITNRAVMQRLDDVCGPGAWRNEFAPGPGGGVVCGLSIRVERADGSAEWVTKWDGASNTDVEAVKGGLSDAMRRAAVQWGIGRYLYQIPQTWVPVDDYGKFATPPRIPREFLPAPAPRPARPAPDEVRASAPAEPIPAPPHAGPGYDGPAYDGPAYGDRPAPRPAPRPAGERPMTERSATERSTTERPTTERPMRDETAFRSERPVAERSSTERSATERPVRDDGPGERPRERGQERPAGRPEAPRGFRPVTR